MRQQSEQRKCAGLVLGFLEKAKYDLSNADSLIEERKAFYHKLLKDAECGIIHDQSIFAVAMPSLYVSRYKKFIKELDNIKESIAYLNSQVREGDPQILTFLRNEKYAGVKLRFDDAVYALRHGNQNKLDVFF